MAFSNTQGGSILLGVSDHGEIKGLRIEKETIQNWLNQIKQGTPKSVLPNIEIIKHKGKTNRTLRLPVRSHS